MLKTAIARFKILENYSYLGQSFPYYCNFSYYFLQIGVVSFGPPEGCMGIGVYTKVAHYTHWIKNKTQDAKCQNNIAQTFS